MLLGRGDSGDIWPVTTSQLTGLWEGNRQHVGTVWQELCWKDRDMAGVQDTPAFTCLYWLLPRQ